MTPQQAQRWLIIASLALTAAAFLFFLLAPTLGYPLTFAQSLRVLEIVLPVFLGYLGSASLFVFRTGAKQSSRQSPPSATLSNRNDLAGLLVRGPIIVVTIALAAVIFAFDRTNSAAAPPGAGITIDQLSAAITVILGVLTVTTNVAVAYLFPAVHKT